MQQELSNEVEISKSEQKVILMSIDNEYEPLQKMIDQEKAQKTHALNMSFDTYIENVEVLNNRLDSEMTNLEASIATSNKPNITGSMSLMEIGEKMDGIRAELEDTLTDTYDFSADVAQIKTQKPQISYESQRDSFRQLLDNIGWTEQKIESSSVRYALDTPINPDKPKDTFTFSPISIATDTDGTVYVLDDGKDGGIQHVIRDNVWKELMYLAKETEIKKMPYGLCVTKDTIYVSYPEADTIAAISKKRVEPLTTLTPQSLPELKPTLTAPHGLATIDKDTILAADTGNNRLLVITKFHQVAQIIQGTPNAPLHQPVSVGACSGLRWRTCNFDVVTPSEEPSWLPCRISLGNSRNLKYS